MACTRRTEPTMSNSLAETPPHFFKVILPSTLEDKRLGMPEKFARKICGELSAVATLRVPNGLVWQVGLTKDERKIWFQDGWHDFVEYHSIGIGYFVVFKYVKNSTFNVLIFDVTACEIHYPYNGGEPGNKKQNVSLKPRLCLPPIEISKFNQGHVPQGKKCKMEELIERNESNDNNYYESLALLEEMGIFITEKYRCHISAEESQRVIDIARLFKPKNPTFMVILLSSYIDKGNLYVPGKFANKYLSRDVKFIKLRVSNGRDCIIKIQWRNCGGFNFTKGWAEFVKKKNLKEGDICVFELIRRKDFLLKVSVFHATTD